MRVDLFSTFVRKFRIWDSRLGKGLALPCASLLEFLEKLFSPLLSLRLAADFVVHVTPAL
jgi:hypothetical protein